MCGINAIYNNKGSKLDFSSIIHKMNNEMIYRGPDSQSIWKDEQIVLGHVRLSIIDLKNGAQPLFSKDKSLVLICNGEIYNYIELKEDLQYQGFEFKTKSDCEVIIYLYQKFGLDFVHYLRGMFALIIWDQKQQKVIVSRDRMGKKPLYYARTINGIAFSSEVKAISKHFLEDFSFNDTEIINSLKYSHPLFENKTFVNEIEKVEPGQLIVFDNDKIEKLNYWSNKQIKRISKIDKKAALVKTKDILTKAVDIRLRSDVPVAVLLSSGIDSTTVATLAKESRNEVHAITVGYKSQSQNDERELARRFAKEKGIIYHEVELDQNDFKNYFDEYTATIDEPVCDIAAIAQWGIYKKAKELGFKVLLSGIGGDELFYGYDVHNRIGLSSEKYNGINQFFPINSFKGYIALFYYIFKNKGVLNFYSKNTYESHFARYYKSAFEDFKKHINPTKLDLKLESELNLKNKNNGVDTVYNYLLNEWLINNCFYQADKLAMGNSIEVRSPFADQELIEYILQLPFETLFDSKKTKGFLKEVMQDDLPSYILNMSKKGFTPPMGYIQDIVSNYNSKYFNSKLFDYNQVLVDRLISSHFSKNG